MTAKKEIGFEVRSLSNLIKRDVERSRMFEFCQSTGLHGWAIGWFYDNRGKDIFQRDFEERFSIRRSTASKMLSLMEKNGLIERVSVEQDARLKKIVLCDRAVELHRKITAEINEREARMCRGIDEQELECFFSVIDKIKNNLEDNDD